MGPRLRRLRAQVPNALSVSRILAAFLFPFLPPEWRLPAVLWALASEFLDGFLARRWHAVSLLGQALDPIADKLFVFATVVVLIQMHRLTWFQFSLLAMRDIIVSIGALIMTVENGGQTIRFLKPRISGKIATTFQFALLIWLYTFPETSRPLLLITEIISCASAVDYLYAVMHRKFDELSPAR